MNGSAASALLLAAALLLPGPGNTSRARGFCGGWLRLSQPEREQVLIAAEDREPPARAAARACRAARRPGLRHALDGECRNWRQLMDFEVRALVDRIWRGCEGAG